jgi:hypothetical protein
MKRQIAPRLANGEARVPFWNSLPKEFKLAIMDIARDERKSASWVVQEILIDWTRSVMRIRLPRYAKPRKAVAQKRIGGARVLPMRRVS